jgi:hypothetical protein
MLQGRTCLKLYANTTMGLAKLVIYLVVIVFFLTIFLLFFVVVDWRFDIGHVCCPFGFLATRYFLFTTPFLKGYHRFQEWLDFGGRGFWKKNKRVK